MDDEVDLVDRLRAGDESAFVTLVGLYQPRMLRLAEATVWSRAVAEEVTQDTWLAVLRGVERFEGRSSFKTWLFRILLNRARSAASREQRAGRPDDSIVEDRFDSSGAWATPPEAWADRVDDRLVAEQLAARVQQLLPALPTVNAKLWCYEISRACLPTTSPTCSASATGTNGCSCTEAAPAFGSSWPPTWVRGHGEVLAPPPSPGLPPSGRVDGRLPRRTTSAEGTGTPQRAPGRVPTLLGVPRPATDDDRRLGRAEPDALTDDALDELVGLYRRWRAEA